jgi:hypothetical protein
MENIEMIISSEDLRKNRAKHLAADKRRAKAKRKETIKNILGIALFYGIIIAYIIAVNM